MKKYFLVHTLDGDAFKAELPKLYLGPWALATRVKSKQKISAVSPYGLKQEEMDSDWNKLQEIKSNIFPEFCLILNKYHKTSYGYDFWNLCLGHWFDRYSAVMLNRYKTLLKCLQEYHVEETYVSSETDFFQPSIDTLAAVKMFDSPSFNFSLNSYILNSLSISHLQLKKLPAHVQKELFSSDPHVSETEKSTMNLGILKKIANYLSKSKIFSPRKIMIYKSYLPLQWELLLSLSFFEFPFYISQSTKAFKSALDPIARDAASRELSRGYINGVEHLTRSLLFKLVPSCYFENFCNLEKTVSEVQSFQNAKLIFTSNGFDFDEPFKLGVAKAKSNGARYLVGQHGAGYGSNRYENPPIEEQTSDNFFTWGWAQEAVPKKQIPMFAFTLVGRNLRRGFSDSNDIVLVQCHRLQRIHTYDTWALHTERFDVQSSFLENIKGDILSNIIIRLHPYDIELGGDDLLRWRSAWPDLKIDQGDAPIWSYFMSSKLLIFSYNSTGFLESLALNVPTIGLWANDKRFLRKEVLPDYQALEDAGILFDDAIDAAAHLEAISTNLNDWWFSEKTQSTVRAFCQKYARKTDAPISQFRKNIKRSLCL